jgi:hypothetical protein
MLTGIWLRGALDFTISSTSSSVVNIIINPVSSWFCVIYIYIYNVPCYVSSDEKGRSVAGKAG